MEINFSNLVHTITPARIEETVFRLKRSRSSEPSQQLPQSNILLKVNSHTNE